MKSWGIALLIAGLLVAGGAFVMDTSVYSPGLPSIGGYGGTEAARTHNLGLLQRQELIFIGGCALFVAGCLFAAVGRIEEVLQHRLLPVDQVALGDDRPSQPAARPYEVDDINSKIWIGAILFAIVMASVFIFVINRLGSGNEAAAAIEANAEMLADNLEAQADNLEELANTIR